MAVETVHSAEAAEPASLAGAAGPRFAEAAGPGCVGPAVEAAQQRRRERALALDRDRALELALLEQLGELAERLSIGAAL